MKFAIFLLLLAPPLAACIHGPMGWPGEVEASAQRVVILHREKHGETAGYQEMMIRVQPKLAGDAGELAWVITVPSTPLRYDVAKPEAMDAAVELYQRLHKLARQQWADRTDITLPTDWFLLGSDKAGLAEDVVEVQAGVAVGPYTITPVRARGKTAAEELNSYLSERGFGAIPAEELQYFIDGEFTFLCVRVVPQAGQTTMTGLVDLPPLVLGFETESPYYPGKFSSAQGDFPLDLTIISDRPLAMRSFAQAVERLMTESHGQVHLVNLYSVKPLPEDLAGALGARATDDAPARWYVNRLTSQGFNPVQDGKPAIAAWENDLFIELGDNTDELPGFWYYGDSEISLPERIFREHALAIFFSFGVLFFGTLFIKTRINRRRLRDQAPSAV
jgi:hypothetical protein